MLCIDGVARGEWEYTIGSYLPIQHWLKDRKNKMLTDNDLSLLDNMIAVIKKTILIMKGIDE